jgi:hypothetical protein
MDGPFGNSGFLTCRVAEQILDFLGFRSLPRPSKPYISALKFKQRKCFPAFETA